MIICLFQPVMSFFITYHHHYYYEDLQRCAKPSSHYILNLRISIEQQALVELEEYLSNLTNTPYDYLTAAEVYLSEAFREINKELDGYGIHIRPDYGQLIMENFPFQYDKASCRSDGVVIERVEVAHQFFNGTAVHGVGNRMLIFFCDKTFSDTTALSYITDVKQCGHILGIMYHDPALMKVLIKDELLKMFSGGNRSDDITHTDFNIQLCNYAKNCVGEIGSIVGEYLSNIRNIKDISGVNFLLPTDSRTRMHSVFDDVSFAGPFHGHARMYPMDDYCKVGRCLNLHPN